MLVGLIDQIEHLETVVAVEIVVVVVVEAAFDSFDLNPVLPLGIVLDLLAVQIKDHLADDIVVDRLALDIPALVSIVVVLPSSFLLDSCSQVELAASYPAVDTCWAVDHLEASCL